MNLNNAYYENLARYFSGECSTQEKSDIEEQVAKDPVFATFVERLRDIWNAKISSDLSLYDNKAAFEHINNEIDTIELSQSKHTKKKHAQKGKLIRMDKVAVTWGLRIAVILMLAGLTSLFAVMYLTDMTEGDSIVAKEVVTNRGQQSVIQLKDGSRIVLNAESRISFDLELDKEVRVVHVVGEAFFDIIHDNRPFYVFADGMVISVLGTEFNVQSYEDKDVKVVVSDGLVSVNVLELEEDSILLERGDMLTLSRHRMNKPVLSRNIDLERYLGWLDYRFTFEDTPMKEVVRVLERSYGVEMEFIDPGISEMRISVSFEGESIHEVLQVIQLVFDLEYEMDGRKVLLSISDYKE